MEQPIVSAVTHSEDEVVFTLRDVPDRPGAAAAIFDAVAAENVNVDTVLQNIALETAELSISVTADEVQAARRALDSARAVMREINVEERADLATVSLVGAGMRSHPGVAAKMFRTLAEAGINPQLISTSPIKITCMIEQSQVERAVRALHAAFELGEETATAGTG
jgi:aspartate kinase